MGIPVKIRTYKNSFLANTISLAGSVIDALFKLLALGVVLAAISGAGLILGLILGAIGFVACVMIGSLLQSVCDRLAQAVALKKFMRQQRK